MAARGRRAFALVLALVGCRRSRAQPHGDEPPASLEDLYSSTATAFVAAHRRTVEDELPGFRALEAKLIAIEGATDRVEVPAYRGSKVRSFTMDAAHPHGLWRESSRQDYEKGAPVWTTLIDVAALNAKEHTHAVFRGAECLPPAYTRCLVLLSPGGVDVNRRREFDTTTRDWVPGGFDRIGGIASWKDENTLYIGAGTTTAMGYPRTSREWTRGTPIAAAKIVFTAEDKDIRGVCRREWAADGAVRDLCTREIDMNHSQTFVLENGTPALLDKPDDATLFSFGDDAVLQLGSAWLSFPAGALLATKWKSLRAGEHAFQALFTPNEHTTSYKVLTTKSHIVATILNDVREEAIVFGRASAGAPWTATPLHESVAGVDVFALDPASDDVAIELQDFTVPKSLVRQDLTTGARTVIATEPATYDSSNIVTTAHFATSKDGAKVPYFEVGPKNRAAPSATILTAYGGFGSSQTAGYLRLTGPVWLAQGGTFVSANIRGGGEYGAEWHRAAMGARNRQRSFDDLAAVAEDLERRGVTTPKQLGILGFSNGGLLTSVMLTQRPELFGAVVSRSPLTDMRSLVRFGGAGYRPEYGDPDNADDWAAMSTWSPLQNVRPNMPYPPMFYLSSTTDDRAHPAHARKMVAMLEADGYHPLYYEAAEGGHEGADLADGAKRDALIDAFFASRLGLAVHE